MKFFIMGMVFCMVIQPILDSLTSLILTFVERIKSYLVFKTAKNNNKINELSASAPVHAIGFHIGEEEEEDDDDL